LKDRCKIFAPQNSFKPVGLEPFHLARNVGRDALEFGPRRTETTTGRGACNLFGAAINSKGHFKLAFGRLDNFKE